MAITMYKYQLRTEAKACVIAGSVSQSRRYCSPGLLRLQVSIRSKAAYNAYKRAMRYYLKTLIEW